MQWKVLDIRILHKCSEHNLSGQMVGWPWQRGRPASSWQPNCKQWAQIRPNCKRGQRSEPMRQCDDAAEPKWATFATQLVLKVAPPLVWMSICMRVPRRLNGCWLAATRSLSEGATGCLSEGATSCLSQGATGCYTLLITGRYRVLHAAYHRVITTWACIDCSNWKVVKGQKLYIHCSGVVQSS